MTKFITKLKIFFIIQAFSFVALNAQNSQQCIDIAGQLTNIGQFEQAISIYRRALYFDNNLAPQIYQNLAECYIKNNNYQQARYYFNLAANIAATDSIAKELWFRIVATYIIENKLLYAENELLGFEPDTNMYFDKKFAFYYGVVLFKTNRVDQSQKYLAKYVDSTSINEFNKYISKAKKINKKNPKTAMWLSVFIPGAGQAYAGNYPEAANSALLNLATTALYFFVVQQYSLLDAVLSVLPWWHRYYIGGFTKAKKLVASQKKAGLDNLLNNIILLQLNNNQTYAL